MELKKSYKGFVLWLIFFCLSMIPIVFINDISLSVRLCMNICLLDILILLYIIYKTENIYWFSGVNYEDVVLVGSERRKIYAKKHVDRFMFFTVLYVVYTMLAQLLGIYYWIDTIVFIVGLTVTALSTFHFKL